jgi:hypothetical protein
VQIVRRPLFDLLDSLDSLDSRLPQFSSLDTRLLPVTRRLGRWSHTNFLPTMAKWADNVNRAVARSFVGKYFRLEGSGHVGPPVHLPHDAQLTMAAAQGA